MPTTTVEDLRIAERVARGCDWLDQRRPGWWERTDLDELLMREPCQCVAGQEFGDFYKTPLMDKEAIEFGFLALSSIVFGLTTPGERANTIEAEYDALDDEWRKVIEERRAGAPS